MCGGEEGGEGGDRGREGRERASRYSNLLAAWLVLVGGGRVGNMKCGFGACSMKS